jgi:hypothetical protein
VAFHWLYTHVGGYCRRRRYRWLLREFRDCRTVIDLGGTVESWNSAPERFPRTTLVNRVPLNGHRLPEGFTYVQADACDSGLDGQPFDLAFSNSAIEHMGTLERQQAFAREMLRLGRRVYCQTPNRWFPIEPHYLAAFVHWLPLRFFGHYVHRWLTLQGWADRPSPEQSRNVRQREAVRLLTRRALLVLFPGCHIRTERFLLWPKSFVVWR